MSWFQCWHCASQQQEQGDWEPNDMENQKVQFMLLLIYLSSGSPFTTERRERAFDVLCIIRHWMCMLQCGRERERASERVEMLRVLPIDHLRNVLNITQHRYLTCSISTKRPIHYCMLYFTRSYNPFSRYASLNLRLSVLCWALRRQSTSTPQHTGDLHTVLAEIRCFWPQDST